MSFLSTLSDAELREVRGGFCPPKATTLPGPSGYHGGSSSDNPGIPDMTDPNYGKKVFSDCTGDDFDCGNPDCPCPA